MRCRSEESKKIDGLNRNWGVSDLNCEIKAQIRKAFEDEERDRNSEEREGDCN